MRKGKNLWLSIIATLMLATVGIAHDKGQDPDMRQLDRDRRAPVVQSRTVIFVRQAITPLLQLTSKSVGQRYNLDETTVNELHQSIHESVEALLKRPESMHTLATAARRGNHDKMLETLLSQPDCKTVFTKDLNEEQFQDYMDFTLARVQRDRGAVARHLTAWLDQQLSLTVDQREKIEQQLIANADKGWLVDAGDILWNRLRPEDAVRLKYPPADVLSQTQLAIWEQLTKFDHTLRIPEHVPEGMIVMVKAKIMEDIKAGKIDREQVEFWIEFWDEDKNDTSESQEKIKRLAAAKLAAHTEQLGPLEESASQRLTLAAKGVVEEYLEAQDEGLKTKYEESDITHHPLYQQTIEDVLSDEAFAQYKARQADRQVFRQHALRDLLVASMDAELFLSDEQRKHFETTAEELFALPVPNDLSAPVYMAHQFFQRTDHELLSPWQREEFERIHRELERKVKFGEKR